MDRSNHSIDKLSFVHIPKTAGLSLHAELANHFGKQKSIRFGDNEGFRLFSSMEPDQLKNYDYITGHITVNGLLKKDIHYPIISVMREPARRLISMQHYLTNSNHKDHQDFNFSNIDQFLSYMFSQKSFNVQCWHLTGYHGYNFEVAAESIRKNNIFVAPLEYYQDFIDTLSHLLGTTLNNRYSNVTQYTIPVKTDDFKHELLEPLIGEDNKLFSYVTKNYENLKQKFIQSISI